MAALPGRIMDMDKELVIDTRTFPLDTYLNKIQAQASQPTQTSSTLPYY